MRLTTIWTMPAMTLRERISRTIEAGWRTAGHHMPRRLAYWTLIDQGVRHIEPNEVVPDVPFMDILQRSGNEITS